MPTLMRWSPPALKNPTVINLPTGFYAGTFGVNEDVVFVMPASARSSDFQSTGGRHIRVIGGACNGGTNGSRMIFGSVSGSVYIEGVSFTMGKVEDVVNVSGLSGYKPDVYLQNIFETGAAGQLATNHTDIYQASGDIGNMYVHRVTADSNYQGFFLPRQFAQDSIDMSYVNLSFNAVTPSDSTTYLLWFFTTDVTAGATSQTKAASIFKSALTEVYVAPRAAQTIAASGVWPASGETLNGAVVGAVDDGSGNVTWPKLPIYGKVFTGSPSGGNFVTNGGSGAGTGYVQPGYSDGTVLPSGKPANTTPPAISGAATQGTTLTVIPGIWTNGPDCFGYQWYRAGAAIAGANRPSYTLTVSDVGSAITVGERGVNLRGAGPEALSLATAVVS